MDTPPSGRTVILASGEFPSHPFPAAILRHAARVVCCDGAVDRLLAAGREPDWIVGDLDSISDAARARFAGRTTRDPCQETNDLSKAFRFCAANGWRDPVILGAGGGREDHLIGNIGLLPGFTASDPHTLMATNHGLFRALLAGAAVPAVPGRPVSLFSIDPRTVVRATGLKYPVDNLRLDGWWTATLNEAAAGTLDIRFTGGPLILFQGFETAPGPT